MTHFYRGPRAPQQAALATADQASEAPTAPLLPAGVRQSVLQLDPIVATAALKQ
jgi:hypothetical protein